MALASPLGNPPISICGSSPDTNSWSPGQGVDFFISKRSCGAHAARRRLPYSRTCLPWPTWPSNATGNMSTCHGGSGGDGDFRGAFLFFFVCPDSPSSVKRSFAVHRSYLHSMAIATISAPNPCSAVWPSHAALARSVRNCETQLTAGRQRSCSHEV